MDRLSLKENEWAKILGAMTFVSAHEVVAKAGPFALEGALRWLEDDVAQICLPSQSWREALARPAQKALEEGTSLKPASLALCAWLVSPEVAREVLPGPRADVQHLAFETETALPVPLRVPTAFMLMALGLMGRSESATTLIAQSFFTVHEALASGEYSSESWRFLSPELPYLGIWSDWDRCRKLRRAVRKSRLGTLARNLLSSNAPLLKGEKSLKVCLTLTTISLAVHSNPVVPKAILCSRCLMTW